MTMTKRRTLRVADLFCGAGGATLSVVRAAKVLDLDLDLLAINHWPVAVQTHMLNFPGVRHLCEDIEKVNPRVAIPGGKLDLLMAGPECTFFSSARGGRPINDQKRSSPWQILKWAQELYISTILIENVPEFTAWAPLGATGRPLKTKKGEVYRAFLAALRALNYKVDARVVCAADHGDPTTRQRLFIVARRGHHQIRWPLPTHSPTGKRTLFGPTKRWRAAREVIDWTLEGQSIFHRKQPLADATMHRILAGLDKFGGPDLKPFLVILRQNMAGQSIEAPLPTVAAGGTHIGLAQPFVVDAAHGRGRAEATRAKAITAPLGTVTASNRFALAQPFVVPVNHGKDEMRSRSVEEPLPTLTGKANQYLVEPFVIANNAHNAPHSLDAPLPTVTGGNRLFVCEPYVLQQQSGGVPRSVEQPLPTIATGGAQSLVEPFLVPLYSERDGQTPRTHSVDAPVPTIPATGGGKFGIVEPFIVPPRGFSQHEKIDSVERPLRTIVAASGHTFGLVEPEVKPATDDAFLASYYGTLNVSSVDDPVPTVTAKQRFGLVMPVVNGLALDIRFRMLKPRELARAHSFHDTYKFTGNIGDQVRQIGNSWPCQLGQALLTEILIDYAPKRRRRGQPTWREEHTA